jgi:hypothetical protein
MMIHEYFILFLVYLFMPVNQHHQRRPEADVTNHFQVTSVFLRSVFSLYSLCFRLINNINSVDKKLMSPIQF